MPHAALQPHVDELRLLDGDLETACGLPNACYTDESIFALEQDRIFARRWMVAAFDHELEPGSAVPVVVAGRPVAIVRDLDGTLRAFHNVCAFNGCEVVLHRTSGLTQLTGLLHGWEWDLQGRLLHAPYLHGRPRCTDAELAALRGDLEPVALATYVDLVLINLSDDPEPIEEFVAPLEERLHGADLSVFIPARRADGSVAMSEYVVEANWKIVIENDVELLHEPFVHQFYRSHPEISPKVDADGNLTAQIVSDRGLYGFHVPASMYFDDEFLASAPQVLTAAGEPLPDFHIYDLYPNLAMGIAPNNLTFTLIEPLSASRTRMVNYYYLHRDTPVGATTTDLVEEFMGEYETARIEDDAAIESVQRGRRSPSFRSTRYAPFWFGLLRDFHTQVRDDLMTED